MRATIDPRNQDPKPLADARRNEHEFTLDDIVSEVPPPERGDEDGELANGDGWPVQTRDLAVSSISTVAGAPVFSAGWTSFKCGVGWHVIGNVFSGGIYVSKSGGGRAVMRLQPGYVLPPPTSREGYYFQSATNSWGVITLIEFGSYEEAKAMAPLIAAAAAAAAASPDFDASQSAGAFTASAAGANVTSASTNVKAQLIVATGANTASIYVAETQAKAALLGAAGGGVEITPGGGVRWKGPAWIASAAGTMTATIGQELTQ